MSTWEFVTSTKCVSPTAPWVSGGRQVPQAVAWSTPSILSTTVEGGARTAAAASAWVSPDLVGAVVSVVTAFSISAAACFAASCSEGGMVGRNGGGSPRGTTGVAVAVMVASALMGVPWVSVALSSCAIYTTPLLVARYYVVQRRRSIEFQQGVVAEVLDRTQPARLCWQDAMRKRTQGPERAGTPRSSRIGPSRMTNSRRNLE